MTDVKFDVRILMYSYKLKTLILYKRISFTAQRKCLKGYMCVLDAHLEGTLPHFVI